MASLPDAGDWSDSPVPPQGSGAGTGTDDIEEMEVMDGATLANNDEDSSVEVVVPPDPEEVEDPLVAILKSRKKEVGSLSDRQKYLSEFVSVGKDKLSKKRCSLPPPTRSTACSTASKRRRRTRNSTGLASTLRKRWLLSMHSFKRMTQSAKSDATTLADPARSTRRFLLVLGNSKRSCRK